MTFSKQRASRLMREDHATVTDAGNKDCRAFIEPSLFVRQRLSAFQISQGDTTLVGPHLAAGRNTAPLGAHPEEGLHNQRVDGYWIGEVPIAGS